MEQVERAAACVSLNKLATAINNWAYTKGFWDSASNGVVTNELRRELLAKTKAQKLMLIVSEVSELLEGLRKPVESGLEGFTNEEEEAADVIIRMLDYAGQYQLRIGEAVLAKMAKNEGRPFKHGKEF